MVVTDRFHCIKTVRWWPDYICVNNVVAISRSEFPKWHRQPSCGCVSGFVGTANVMRPAQIREIIEQQNTPHVINSGGYRMVLFVADPCYLDMESVLQTAATEFNDAGKYDDPWTPCTNNCIQISPYTYMDSVSETTALYMDCCPGQSLLI